MSHAKSCSLHVRLPQGAIFHCRGHTEFSQWTPWE